MRSIAGRLGLAVLVGAFAVALAGPGVASASLSISAPSLKPRFRIANPYYTVDCARPVRLAVRSGAAGPRARIAGRSPFRGREVKRVPIEPGEAVVVHKGGRRWTVRCTPEDFPDYRYRSRRPARVGLFVVAPQDFSERGGNYVIVFNGFGAPVWWHFSRRGALDGKVLPDGTIAYASYFGGGYGADPRLSYHVLDPSGRELRELQVPRGNTDHHDLEPTRDGNYLMISYQERANPIDARPFVRDASAEVIDGSIQKLSPRGRLLWSWNSRRHIGLRETGRWWWSLTEPYDLVHINAVEELPRGDLLVSMRHTDAVYRIDGKTGEIVWKLGGTPTPGSLSVTGDPLGYPFGGQHDVRALADGTITVFDNGTGLERAPRATRWRIDGRTARLVESISDRRVKRSSCCGSARRTSDSWLVSWGGTGAVGEFLPSGKRTFKLGLGSRTSYRAAPVQGIGARALSRGMDSARRAGR